MCPSLAILRLVVPVVPTLVCCLAACDSAPTAEAARIDGDPLAPPADAVSDAEPWVDALGVGDARRPVCPPHACDRTPRPRCDGEVSVVAELPAACHLSGGMSVCEFREARQRCARCSEGDCLPLAEPPGPWLEGRRLRLTTLRLAPTAEGVANAIGALRDEMERFGERGAADLWLTGALATGRLSVRWISTFEAEAPLAAFFGGPYPTEPETVWSPEDFVPGTDVPLSRGRVTSATADAFEASFERLVFRFPFDVIALDAPLRAVAVSAHRTGAGWRGTLHGVIVLDDIDAAVNATAAEQCGCLALGDVPLVSRARDAYRPCIAPPPQGCTPGGADFRALNCDALAQFCLPVFDLLTPDATLYAGPAPDALTIVLEFTAVEEP
ncbi:hypothetical protein L6V77_31005 [Myxococcota bacterium]|nr:hypothetical protein [Myxococcota bacterium]